MRSLSNKGRGRRLGWISAVVLVSVAAISVVLLRFNFRDAIDNSDILGGLAIKARCAIASGRGLAADSVRLPADWTKMRSKPSSSG
jgi:hypothetical protein